jgi:hypothetical protein
VTIKGLAVAAVVIAAIWLMFGHTAGATPSHLPTHAPASHATHHAAKKAHK